jgi:enoyl-CoA hydratase/carnithine racemase
MTQPIEDFQPETIKFERQGGIGIVTLNRPHRLNALNLQMVRELRRVVNYVERDDTMLVLIFTGGPRPDGRPCFCAGADMIEFKEANPDLEGTALWNKLGMFLKPTIAVIDGICTAGGMELAEICDLRVVAETAQISDLHLKNNLMGLGGWGASTYLPRIVGQAKAKEMILTGMVIDGREAWRIGFANRVFPAAELMPGAIALAEQIAKMHPKGVKITLAHIKMAADMTTDQALRWAKTVPGFFGGRPKLAPWKERKTTEKSE